MGGWVDRKIEEIEAVRMRCCNVGVDGRVGGWVGGWVYLPLLISSCQPPEFLMLGNGFLLVEV